jgi:hypothetical protein
MKEFDELEEELSKKNNQEEVKDGRSLKDLLKEKRENTEKILDGRPQ